MMMMIKTKYNTSHTLPYKTISDKLTGTIFFRSFLMVIFYNLPVLTLGLFKTPVSGSLRLCYVPKLFCFTEQMCKYCINIALL